MVSSTENFFADIAENKKFCFLLGNGINYALASPVISWEKLLYQLAQEVDVQTISDYLETASDEDEISYPELFCLLENLGDTGKKKGGSLRKMIADILSQPQKSNDLLEYARQNNCPILTTNFDFNIENAIGCKQSRSGKYFSGQWSERLQYSSGYRIGEFFAPDTSVSPENQCSVWHIHGHIQSPGTIKISQLDYINAIAYFKKKLFRNCDNSEHRNPVKAENDWIAKDSWLNYFFNRPLIIAGCSLKSDETFLRWLLLYRFRRQKEVGQVLQSYYLTEKKSAEKTLFWENIGFKVINFENYDKIYFNKKWKEEK